MGREYTTITALRQRSGTSIVTMPAGWGYRWVDPMTAKSRILSLQKMEASISIFARMRWGYRLIISTVGAILERDCQGYSLKAGITSSTMLYLRVHLILLHIVWC